MLQTTTVRKFAYLAVALAVAAVLLLVAPNPDSKGLPNDVPAPVVDRYDAIGDSITYGEEFGFSVDRLGRPRKTAAKFLGWPALLGQMLAEKTGSSVEVLNRGRPGERVEESRIQQMQGFVDDKSRSSRALLLIGTNDSNEFKPTPSGLGCTGIACANTYKRHMQLFIQGLQAAGRERIYVGLLTPVWGPDPKNPPYENPLDFSEALRNKRIVEYNQVITDELWASPDVEPGPDFFSCFLTPTVNRFSLFEDTLHPNTLGYVFMAALWRDAITEKPGVLPVDSCAAPVYILESLDPYVHGHKQNLLAEGDEYYTDESFVLTNIPIELADGIWVTQANADNANRDESFLTFDVGQAPVSVYIAHDPAGNPPLSLSHRFSPIALSDELRVSDPGLGAFSLAKAQGVTGVVNIGGNKSASGAAPQQGYVVIVVP